MFFTRTGLEQATRAVVADRRAARLAAAGVRTVADLGCGLGADALAAARAGMRVYAVEADPVTAALAEANAQALGLSDRVTVSIADATTVDVSGADAVFCDPARRRVGTGRRVFDPNDYSPPWDFVLGLAARVPRTVVKVAPGIDHELIPPGAEAEWVSVDGEVVEAALWCGPLARTPRRATLLSSRGRARELVGPPDVSAPAGNVRRFLYDPDGAVVRAHLVAAFATTVDGVVADPTIAYVYADAHRSTPFARRFRVHDVLGFSLKRLRALLRERGIGRVEILKRGSAIDPEHLRRELRLSGAGAATLVLTRVAGAPTTLICDPVD
jgi:SAM-dependent methyltransferase